MVWWIAGAIVYALALGFIWCLCVVSARADERESHLLAEWPEKEWHDGFP